MSGIYSIKDGMKTSYFPLGGTEGQILQKTSNGIEWKDPPPSAGGGIQFHYFESDIFKVFNSGEHLQPGDTAVIDVVPQGILPEDFEKLMPGDLILDPCSDLYMVTIIPGGIETGWHFKLCACIKGYSLRKEESASGVFNINVNDTADIHIIDFETGNTIQLGNWETHSPSQIFHGAKKQLLINYNQNSQNWGPTIQGLKWPGGNDLLHNEKKGAGIILIDLLNYGKNNLLVTNYLRYGA